MNLIIWNMVERSPAEGKSYPLQYSGLENSMDSIVHGIAKSQTRLSDIHFTFIVGKYWGHVALMVQEQLTRMKTEHEIWYNGSGNLQPLLDWGAEYTLRPAFIPNCRLQDFLRPYLSQDTCCVNRITLNVLGYTDIVNWS